MNDKDGEGTSRLSFWIVGNMRSEIKAIAVTLYLRGLSFRKVSEILGVSHVSVSRWFKELVETVDNQIIIKKDNKIYKNLEIDELFTFEKKKVKNLYLHCN